MDPDLPRRNMATTRAEKTIQASKEVSPKLPIVKVNGRL